MLDTTTQKTQKHLHVTKPQEGVGVDGEAPKTKLQCKCETLCPYPTYTKLLPPAFRQTDLFRSNELHPAGRMRSSENFKSQGRLTAFRGQFKLR